MFCPFAIEESLTPFNENNRANLYGEKSELKFSGVSILREDATEP